MTGTDAAPRGRVEIHHGDNLAVAAALPDASFTLVYLDPPFNTGRKRQRAVETARTAASAFKTQPKSSLDVETGPIQAVGSPEGLSSEQLRPEPAWPEPAPTPPAPEPAPTEPATEPAPPEPEPAPPVRRGFHGREYARLRGDLRAYDDRFDDYWGFLEPRLREAWRLLADDGTLYLHLDFREVHYAKVLMDALFGRERFLNEIVWAYDYGAKTRRRWPTKHETILVYVKDPQRYWFDSSAVDREPYMAPGLVTPEKAARGKLPTDVWWHTIVPTTGSEKTGYPTQKPEGILRRIVQASSRQGDRVLDLFAGSGTTGAVAAALGRHAVLVDDNPDAIAVMRARMPYAVVHSPLG
ncbi:site-specific DNA-methyltransferase [Microbacterium protaetiae]|uniref:Methyltransferase n=1 Tax=Microbacterium protaetiae TaxID=2509458 RepID=A0A4P6EH28_9MICO|nr:site-specific DNA-methyltransferase [Microbacterium protaetiae]